MSRKKPTQHRIDAVALRAGVGETIHIGPDIEIQATRAEGGRIELSIYAPREFDIDRAARFRNSKNSDGQGVAAPQPSCQVVPSSTKIQE